MHYTLIGLASGNHGQQERLRSFNDPTIGQQSSVSDTRDSPYDSLCLTYGHDPSSVCMRWHSTQVLLLYVILDS